MRTRKSNIRSSPRPHWGHAAIAIALSSFWMARAADVTWDISPGLVGAGNGSITGGPGTWDTSLGNWTSNGGADNIAWNNANNDVGIFGGTAGIIDLGNAITAGGLTFNNAGFTVSGNTLTLAGTPVVTVGTGMNATIGCVIDGAVGFTKSGLGTLILAGSNIHAGSTSITGGVINLQNANALGNPATGITVNSNTALQIQGGVTIATEPLSIRGGGFNGTNTGALRSVSGNNQWSGPITLVASARFSSDSGTFILGGITAGTASVVLSGLGNITINGAITGTTGGITIDNFSNATVPAGIMTLKGADTFAGTITVTNGTLEMQGNRTAASGGIIVGDGPAQTGILNLKNGNFSTGANNIIVGSTPASASSGSSGTGVVHHSGGILSTTGLILLGNIGTSATISAGTGTYHLSGGSLKSTSTNLAAICIGTNTGGTAIFSLSDSGILEMTGAGAFLQIGRSSSTTTLSSGTFYQSGGTATLANIAMGNASNSNTTSVLNLTGGIFSVSTSFSAMAAGASSTAAINIGGLADVTLPAFPTNRGAGSSATLTFNGGILRPTAASSSYIAGLTSATIKAGGITFAVASGRDIGVSQDLLGDSVSTGGGLTKTGPGALMLSGFNTYQGPTSITGGSLIVASSGRIDAASQVNVAAAAKLGGSGVVAGTVISSGTIAPGSTIGTLATGAVDLTGGTLAIDVSGPSVDRLYSSGVIKLSGTNLVVSEVTPGAAVSYVIAEGSSIMGTFASSSLPAGYSIEYTSTRVILKLALTIRDYPTWSAVNGLDATNNGTEMDPDTDETSNLMEYVLGGIPVGAGSGGMSMLPVSGFSEGSPFFNFNFERSVVSRSDTIQSVSISNDLITWNQFANIGNASEGAVMITPNVDKDSVSVAIPRANAVDGKLFARLEVEANFPIVAEEPGMMEISRHWAPVVYQDVREGLDFTRQLYGARDSFVAMNFDGDWDVANNWHNSRYQASQQGTLSDRLTPPLHGKAYSAVVESLGFHFITYGFYHSGQDSFFSAARHQNDWEVVTLAIRKDGTRFGKLEGMMTQFHTNQNTYPVSGIKFSEHRPIVYIESNGGIEGHGIEAYSNQSPGSDGLVYHPGASSANATAVNLGTSGNWNTAPRCQYKLIPISEMWGLIGRTGLNDPYAGWKLFNYARAANYPDYEHEPEGGNPSWDRDFFEEPLVFFGANFPELQAELATDSYVFNPYLNGASNQSGPNNPNGLLPVSTWIKTQIGGTTGSAWNHRAETTLYHRNGTGTGDRFSFNNLSVTGDFVIQGKLHSVQDISNSQSGLMIRSSTADTSRMICLLADADHRVHLQYRTQDSGSLSAVVDGVVPSSDQPVWLRLERKAGEVSASYSYQEFGGSFSTLAVIPISMDGQVHAGMASKSSSATYFSASTMTDLELESTSP